MPVLYDEGIIDVAVTAAASLLFTSARSRSAVHDFAVANAAAGRLPPLAPDAKPTMLVAGANRPVCSSDYTLEHRILFLFRIEKIGGLCLPLQRGIQRASLTSQIGTALVAGARSCPLGSNAINAS